MGLVSTYSLRLRRRRLNARAWRKRLSLNARSDRTRSIRPADILVFTVVRNEAMRLPYFLRYYRNLGVSHFLIVDNGSDDGTAEYLEKQSDVSVFSAPGSYKQARFGMDWVNGLLNRYANGHWALVVDADEFFVYPFCDTRPLEALTDWLDASSIRSFGALLLDMYPKGPLDATPYRTGEDPFEVAGWFDPGNYTITKNPLFHNLWIQGGARARTFFADRPERAPALNKIPLVKWRSGYAFASSTHMLLPRGLNLVYDAWGGEKTSGCLLHAKFLHTFAERSAEEIDRREHFSNASEYQRYGAFARSGQEIWCQWSEKYINWRQLDALGLMSKGNWA
ncbi:MAG: glycosyltransferase family 2 protein [Pseudomonadota bacterium]